jgi:cephalosporin hydroxylase
MFNRIHNKIYNKLILHFINPIKAIKFDLRKILFLLKKYKIHNTYNLKIFFNKKELFQPDYLDLDNLINLIIKIKPKLVLELGGGYSTLAIAYALDFLEKEYNHKYRFITFDQSEIYLKISKSLIPEKLQKNIEFIHSPLIVKKIDNTLMSFYKDLKILDYDFIYEDRHDHSETKIAGDIYLIEKLTNHPFSFCIDGMKSTVEFYKRNLKRSYKISSSFFHGVNFLIKNY